MPSRWHVLDVSLEAVRRVLGFDLDLPSLDGLVEEPLALVTRALAAETASHGASGALFAEAMLIALIARLAAIAGIPANVVAPAGAVGVDRLARVKEAIEGSLGGVIRVGQLAALVELSPAHFAREFKRLTGETPHAYVMRRRLERARDHLLEGTAIAQVAAACGFADQAHLTRLFRTYFGVTPGRLRPARTRERRRAAASFNPRAEALQPGPHADLTVRP